MKTKLLCAAVFCALLAVCALRADVNNTARACRRNINEWGGKNVSLDVVFLNPIDAKGSLPDNAMLVLAYTWDDKNLSFGGAIPVLFQKTEGERALKRYGITGDFNGTVRSRSLRGVLTRIFREGRSNLIYLDCSNSGPYAEEIKPSLAKVLDTIPEDVADPMQPITPAPSGGGGGGAVVVVPSSNPTVIINNGGSTVYVPVPTRPVVIIKTNPKPTTTPSTATSTSTTGTLSKTKTSSGLTIQSGGSSVTIGK